MNPISYKFIWDYIEWIQSEKVTILQENRGKWWHQIQHYDHSLLKYFKISKVVDITCFPSLAFWSLATVAKTVAACSPPITEIRAFGHIKRNLGLKNTNDRIKISSAVYKFIPSLFMTEGAEKEGMLSA